MNPIITRTRAAIWTAVTTESKLSRDAQLLWNAVLDEAVGSPRLGQGARVIGRLGWDYQTTIQAMIRRALPSPRMCADWVALCYAAALFDGPDDRTESIALTLGHSARQSFSRSMHRLIGKTATEFRETTPYPVAREMMLDQVVRPYTAQWATFAHVVHRPRYAGPPRSLVAA